MVRVFIDEPSQGFAGRPPMPQALKHPQLPHRSGQAALDSLAQERQPGVDLRRVNAPSQQAGARHRQDPKCQVGGLFQLREATVRRWPGKLCR